MTYILIIVLHFQVTAIEFTSKDNCEAAIQWLSEWAIVNGVGQGQARCLQK